VVRKTREDRITLAGIKINPHIGTTPEERANPQECQADLTIWGDFEGAAAMDSLDGSVDYCQVLALVQETANSREYHLLETLAYGIVRKVLQGFPISGARIKLRKRPEGLQGEIDFVEVEVEET
jgi:dihydroneopterin aldolase